MDRDWTRRMQQSGIDGDFLLDKRGNNGVELAREIQGRQQFHLFGAIGSAALRPGTTLISGGLRGAGLAEVTEVLTMPPLTAIVTFLWCGFPTGAGRGRREHQYCDARDSGQNADGPVHDLSMFLVADGVNVRPKTTRRACR